MKSLISLTQKSIKEDATASCSTWCAGQDMKGLMKKLFGCWPPSLIMPQNLSPTFMSGIRISLDLTLNHKMTKNTINFYTTYRRAMSTHYTSLPSAFDLLSSPSPFFSFSSGLLLLLPNSTFLLVFTTSIHSSVKPTTSSISTSGIPSEPSSKSSPYISSTLS